MAELCRHFGIARKTGYKIVERWQQQGADGLKDLSRAPLHHPNQTPADVEAAVLALRHAHMSWGPRKLRARLEAQHPEQAWPAASTIGALLGRAGLAHARRLRRRTPPWTQPFAAATGANAVWCADFKGWFRTRDGERIDPLTMTDAASRYLLRCQAVEKADTAAVHSICEAAFREYGLPLAIRTRRVMTDNAPAFMPTASATPAGLWTCAMCAPAFTRLAPMAKPNASSRPPSASGSMPGSIRTPPNALPRFPSGPISTTGIDPTPPPTTTLPSLAPASMSTTS